MFTEGLDDSAISWIKKESAEKKASPRSPLAEKLSHNYGVPRSPLAFNTSSYASTHVLPPLKFHSGFFGTHSTVGLGLDSSDDDFDESNVGDGSESVASVPDELDVIYTSAEKWAGRPFEQESEEELFDMKWSGKGENGLGVRNASTLNRGLLKEDLRIEIPGKVRRFTDGGLEECDNRSISGPSSRLLERVLPHSAYATPMTKLSELGTPSAPPIFDIREEVNKSIVHDALSEESRKLSNVEQTTDDEVNMPKESAHSGEEQFQNQLKHRLKEEFGESGENVTAGEAEAHVWQKNELDLSPCYDASGQNAWQIFLAYDACIRLCLNAWARGCTEAPEFLKDECYLLRSSFGLHKLLLHPRGKQPSQRSSKFTEQVIPLKMKKVVGKIRVEVRNIRIIPKRRLKDSNSMRSLYVQKGADYVKQVSSLMKSGINSLKLNSFSLTSEEQFSCSVYLRSSTEGAQLESGSTTILRPGTEDYREFFPENEGDALIAEVYDSKKNSHGQSVIPISSMMDNPNDKIRWWPIHHSDGDCVGKIQLSILCTFTRDETSQLKSGPIVETLAYDLLLEAGLRAQHFQARNLSLSGPWNWLLTEFAEYYGVSDSYTKLRYLSYVMNVATPTKDCLKLVHELLIPVIKERNEKNLTRQEKSILMDCGTKVERLLADVFQNYKSLDENSSTGLTGLSQKIPDTAAPALAPAVEVYTLLHDVLAQDAQKILRDYLQTAASKRCRKHMVETDEYLSGNSEGFVMDSLTISTAYLKMKVLCINISNEIQADIKMHNEHILPSSIDLPSITATVYSTELSRRLAGFLAMWPPSSPLPHVNDLLTATADFERNLQSWNISIIQGGVDSRNLFHNYIMVWIEDMQLVLLELCKAEKLPWSGVATNYSTSPFTEDMYDRIKEMLIQYGVVINRWPQYTLVLENAVANVERAIVKALERQYSDILTPLKDSIQKRLGKQVQKLARRQSTALYSVPSQLGTFLNTIKRMLDVLHCKIEDILKSWAAYLPVSADKKSAFGEQMNGITVLLKTKYKNYLQAIVVKLASNMQANRNTRLQRILEETKESDGESEIRERMRNLNSLLSDSISNLHEVFTGQIFVALSRGLWDRMGQIVLKFFEGRKENRVWYAGAYHALGILDDIFASQMQRLQGNALQDKDLEPPRSISEARSILC
ncbi:hypothetical protein LIER_19381 [Lithospermum erythrorhizon]|uniref:Uncharacterized protein n=1 Tax=Lithospermum erythrorhizon TaxID=34254 RepID=A0AAV3QK40_LITER